ncbi:MAG: hypothetical protein NTV30_03620 [Chloroflexi bacterium]|nr:hypothetical protein [Chloroflexota bacterium]
MVKRSKSFLAENKGIGLVETLVAVFILGAIGVALTSAVISAYKTDQQMKEYSTAESLVRTQMGQIQNAAYIEGTGDEIYPVTVSETGYNITIFTEEIHTGLQKIIVKVVNGERTILKLESYKASI